jgi:hypothetical protein
VIPPAEYGKLPRAVDLPSPPDFASTHLKLLQRHPKCFKNCDTKDQFHIFGEKQITNDANKASGLRFHPDSRLKPVSDNDVLNS